MELNKCVIVNTAFGNCSNSWYPEGQFRLRKSLDVHGWQGDTLFFCNQPINKLLNLEYQNTSKIAAIYEAIKKGYTNILWVDCSGYAIKNINQIFEIIESEGCFFINNGFSLSEICGDKDLEWAGITRDEADKLGSVKGGVFGFKYNTEKGKIFFDLLKDGIDICNKHRELPLSTYSSDARYKYICRDQSLISLALIKTGYTKTYPDNYLTHQKDANETNNTVVLILKGI
jgi:hypothetical protein